jgi:uncharacterized protein (TIGR02421 family)
VNITHYNTLEERFWKLYRQFYIEQYINPTNLDEEKRKFLTRYAQGETYNPLFTYKYLEPDMDKVMKELDSLRDDFLHARTLLDEYYIILIDNFQNALQQLQDRKSNNFTKWLTTLYGRPSESLLSQASLTLHNLPEPKKELSELSASKVADIFQETLAKRSFTGWNIIIEEIPARMSINQMTSTVKIKASAKFSKSEVKRLIVHEIDTHVLRAENAKKQPYLLFRYGFPNYLKTEEGLAIFSEEQKGLLTPYDKQKYALRVLAADFTCEYTFYDVFKKLHQTLDAEDAFSMTARVKRGLTDTSLKGGYTKDQVYLDGYLSLKSMKKEEILKLYYGKVGVNDVQLIAGLPHLNEELIYPEWYR